jgi:hypothetical protein
MKFSNWFWARPWLFPLALFALVIAAWTTFYVLARQVPMFPIPVEESR